MTLMMRIVGRVVPHRLINELIMSLEVKSIGIGCFGKTKSKTIRAYDQSGQYHTIVKNNDS